MYKLCLIILLLVFIILLNLNNTESFNNNSINNPNDIKLIGICVSYNYMDTLKYILPINHKHFEKIYIVTQKDDHKTIEFCNKFDNVEIVYFDFKEGGRQFNFGGGRKAAQEIAYREYPDHWYLMFDSDIVLPDNFKDILNKKDLNPDEMYGCERCIITDKNDLQKCKDSTYKNIISKVGVNYKEVCIGYFQLYKQHKLYKDSDNAGGVDNIFRKQFKRSNLDMIVYHLGVPFINWKGKTKNFNNNVGVEYLNYIC
jgi:hypothetical protein